MIKRSVPRPITSLISTFFVRLSSYIILSLVKESVKKIGEKESDFTSVSC